MLQQLYDDKDVINKFKMVNYYGKIHVFVVHRVNEPKVVENELNKVLDLCRGLVESGDGSHVGGEGDEVEVHDGMKWMLWVVIKWRFRVNMKWRL